ncbi:hypothetical protein M3D15_04745 [Pseudoclavibacter alba]|uniref:Uncharacterized protein n=1 Tax=Pseudoclavibacter albus TaxID=272241 RepID=A0ABT2HWE6_9MICO|nr:hypothetical protein [Pseudoclavibacter alba]MCT2042643.1 hypothetical protein [Pseudoclavibacter alba]
MPNVPSELSPLMHTLATVGADYNIAVIDGQPEVTVDAKGMAQLIKHSPLGVSEATRRMRAALPEYVFAKVEGHL